MVDVGAKPITVRRAVAVAEVRIPAACRRVLAAGGDTRKGNVFAVARLAGIMAAKRTHELIPLCHPLALDAIDVEVALTAGRVRIRAAVACQARTGVEMEALTAAGVAALTVYDMLKAISHDLIIDGVQLLEKDGGRSGRIRRRRT